MPDWLGDLLVLDLSTGPAGAFAAKHFVDAGAEVIRVETEPFAESPASPIGDTADIDASAAYAHLHAGKSSVVLDPCRAEDRGTLLGLAAAADAVIEDRAPGSLDSAGLGYSALSGANQRLVLTSITPFGQTGPYRDYRANDLLAAALGGRLGASGVAPRQPVRLAPDTAMFLAGAAAAGATLAAVLAARRDGAGDHIDVSVAECLLGQPDRASMMWEFSRVDSERLTSPRPLQTFPCRDGFIAIALNRGIERVARAIGQEWLAEDPRFATNLLRQQHAGDLEAVIALWTLERTRVEAFEHLQRYEVISAPVYQPGELFDDPQFEHREAFQSLAVGGREIRLPRPPYREAGRPPGDLRPPPAPGEHTEAVRARAADNGPPATDRRPAPVSRLPLEGFRVIDFGDAWAGPYACVLLADAGAEVIKVEDIHRMPANMRGPRVPAPPYNGYIHNDPGERPWERFYLYHGCERNKLGVTLDLKQEAGRDLFLRLVAESDLVVTNYTPSTLRALRLEFDDLKAVNPQLALLQISGYGIDGPYSDYVALGSTVDAISGHQASHGYPETAPAETAQTYFPDAATAYTGFFAGVAALSARARAPRPRHIELSLCETMFGQLGHLIGAASAAGDRPARGNRDPGRAPQGCYPTLPLEDDGTGRRTGDRWIAISCGSELEWTALLDAMGDGAPRDDPRFADLPSRMAHHDELDALIGEWTARHHAADLMHRLQERGVPAVAVLTDADVFDDPHIVDRGFFRRVSHPFAGEFRAPGPIWRSLRHQPGIRLPANALGQHNRDVFCGLLGLDESELTRLEAAEVCGERYVLEPARGGQ